MKNLVAAVSAFCVGTAQRLRAAVPRAARGFASFSVDFIDAAVTVPHEMRRWWKQAHYLSPYLQGGKVNHDAGRTDVSSSAQDYVIWKRLGVASDLMLIVLAGLIVMLVLLAVL